MDVRAKLERGDSMGDEAYNVQWDTSMFVGLFPFCLPIRTAFSDTVGKHGVQCEVSMGLLGSVNPIVIITSNTQYVAQIL